MISSLLHLVGLRPRVYYTLTNFRCVCVGGGGGVGKVPLPPLNKPMNTLENTRKEMSAHKVELEYTKKAISET